MSEQLNSVISKIFSATFWTGLALLVLVIVLIRLIMWIKASLREDDDPSSIDHQMLVEITEMQRQGEITEAEYRSIKGRLVDRLKKEGEGSIREPVSD